MKGSVATEEGFGRWWPKSLALLRGSLHSKCFLIHHALICEAWSQKAGVVPAHCSFNSGAPPV